MKTILGALWCVSALLGLMKDALPQAVSRSSVERDSAFRLRFVNADVSDVIMAIGVRTRANIVYPAGLKRSVSLDISASSAGEALGYVTAAAGLVYRQVGRTYVVGQPSDMRRLMEQFGERVLLEPGAVSADVIARMLTEALPYAQVAAAGSRVIVTGSIADIATARDLISREQTTVPPPPEPSAHTAETVNFVPPTQIAAVLKSMLPGIKVEAIGVSDKPGGSVGLSGPKSLVESARELVKRLDVPTRVEEKAISFMVYKVRYSSAPELKAFAEKAVPGVVVVVGPESYGPPAAQFRPLTAALQSAQGGTGGSGGGSGGAGGAGGGTGGAGGGAGQGGSATPAIPGEKAGQLVLSGRPGDVSTCMKLLAEVDIPPRMVLVEVQVVDTSPEATENLGLTWDWLPLGGAEAPPGTNFNFGTTNLPLRQGPFGAISRMPVAFQAKLNAMATRKEAKILARPRVQVNDNEDANIFIGDTLRTVVSQSSLAGTNIQVLEFPVGIILLVRPRVNEDGYITMRLHPVVSTVTGIGAGNLPQTSSREAETTVRVKDGETVTIGGLIRDEMTKTIQEVPILSKLPLVGELFRNRSTGHRHSEILVFITPHIVK